MAEVIILGSGAGFATRDRFNTSIALLSTDEAYILDCGEPCSALLFRNGIDPLSIRGIFISHMHPDHVGGLPQLLFSIYLPSRSAMSKHRAWSIHFNDPWYGEHLSFPPPEVRQARGAGAGKAVVTVAVPREAVEPLRAFLPILYLMDEVLPFKLELQSIGEGPFYQDRSISLSAYPNDHLAKTELYRDLPHSHPYLNRESYSFVVWLDGKKLVFSGDINSIDEITPLLPETDLLIVEIAHVAPEEILPLLERKDVGRVVLTHIHPALEERVKKLFLKNRNERMILAHDGLRVNV